MTGVTSVSERVMAAAPSFTRRSSDVIKWCHAGKPGTASARPDTAESKVRGGGHKFGPQADTNIRPGTRTGKLGRGGIAVETHNAGDGFTTLSITCGDDVGVVHKVSFALVSAGMTIVAAVVITNKADGATLATEKFKLLNIETSAPLPENQHPYLQKLLIRVLESSLADFKKSNTTKVEHAFEIESLKFSNDQDAVHTVIDLVLKGRPGLLRDLTFVLMSLDVNIDNFSLTSGDKPDSKSIYQFSITTSDGKQLNKLLQDTVESVMRDEACLPNTSVRWGQVPAQESLRVSPGNSTRGLTPGNSTRGLTPGNSTRGLILGNSENSAPTPLPATYLLSMHEAVVQKLLKSTSTESLRNLRRQSRDSGELSRKTSSSYDGSGRSRDLIMLASTQTCNSLGNLSKPVSAQTSQSLRQKMSALTDRYSKCPVLVHLLVPVTTLFIGIILGQSNR